MAGGDYRLAIRLEDVQRLPDDLRHGLLGGRLDTGSLLTMGQGERREPVPAVPFNCSLLEAALVCDLVRSYDRKSGYKPSDLYICRGGSVWARLRSSDVLTVTISGVAALNPTVFPSGPALVDTTVEARPVR